MDEICPVLREDDAARDLAHLVPGPADPLQPARDGWRGLDLDDEVDRTHVDAEFERAGGDNAAQPPGLEVVFNAGPLILGHRAVVCACEEGGCTRGDFRLPDGRGQPLRIDLIKPRCQPLGKPPRVSEDDGRPVLQDVVDDLLLDVRPDRPLRCRPGGGALERRCRAKLGHVLDGHHHGEIELLRRLRGDDRDRRTAGEKPCHVLVRSNGGRQPDPLRRLLEQQIQPFERHGQVRAAFGRRNRVHLIHDHRLQPAQGVARRRGEHQVQRLRCGDQDVGRPPLQQAPVRGRSVSRTHTDGDFCWLQPEPFRGLGHAHERCAEVPFHVHREGLERRDVEHAGAPQRVVRRWGCRQPIDRPEECGQGLARTGGRDDEGVGTPGNGLPGAGLGIRRRAECTGKPFPGCRGEAL